MGAKTWMLVYSNGEAAEKLAAGVTLDRAATNSLIGKLFPNEKMDAIEDGNLAFTNPPNDIIYAGCFGAVSIVAAKEFAGDYPFVFHPLDLGEAALKVFFGYQLEGYPEDDLYDPEGVPLCGYRRLKMKPWWKVW